MRLHKFDSKVIEKSFRLAEKKLLDKSNAHVVQYKGYDITTFDKNNKSLLTEIASNSIIYCLWLGKHETSLSPIYWARA